MAGLRRRQAGGPDGRPPVDHANDAFRALWPALWEFVSLTEWPSGAGKRTPGSLLVFQQDDVWKVRLVDNDTDEVAFWAGESFEDVLSRVEQDLNDGRGDWRRQRDWRGPARRRS